MMRRLAAVLTISVFLSAGIPGTPRAADQPPAAAVELNGERTEPPGFVDSFEAMGWQVLREAVAAVAAVSTYKGHLSPGDAIGGMLDGLVSALDDPYAAVIERSSMDGRSSGGHVSSPTDLGLILDRDEFGRLRVASVLPASPAEVAGVRPGDLLLRVGGTNVAGLSPWEALPLLRTKPGTTVSLVVSTKESGIRPLQVTAVPFHIDTVRLRIGDVRWGRFRDLPDGSLAWVRVHAFLGQQTLAEWNAAVAAIRAAPGVETIILDLRDNGGGDNSCLRILGDLVPSGQRLVTFESLIGADGWREHVSNRFIPRARLMSYPAAVLVNGNTASLSEIFAAALRDIRGVPIIGEQTFGKGSTQTWITVGRRFALHLTVGRWRSPGGMSVSGVGISPDVEAHGTDGRLVAAALRAVNRKRAEGR